MLPFPKRSPAPEEYFLRSGDFEAVPQDSYSGFSGTSGSPSIPAPLAPVFVRQAAITPYGFAQSHSLAPMGFDSSARDLASTGTNPVIGRVVARAKPGLKWGVMIALTGAILGGVLGLGMDHHRQSARAAAAAEASDNAPRAMVGVPVAPVVPQAPPPVAAQAPPPVAAQAPTVLAAVAPVVVAPAKGDVAPKAKHAKTAASAARPRGVVAAKVSAPARPVPEKADAPEKTEKTEKIEKSEKSEAKRGKSDPPAKPAGKNDATTSDALKTLEAASSDTANTL